MPPRKSKPVARQHLITKYPKVIVCGKCSQTILIGLQAGMITRYDISPLSPWGELEAIRDGRRTFYLIPIAQHLGERTPSIIRRELRPRLNGVVIREHRCFTPRSTLTEVPKRVGPEDPDTCPF